MIQDNIIILDTGRYFMRDGMVYRLQSDDMEDFREASGRERHEVIEHLYDLGYINTSKKKRTKTPPMAWFKQGRDDFDVRTRSG